MQKANPIRRRFRGQWSWIVSGEQSPRANRQWVAVCPKCSLEIAPKRGYPHYATPTRKTAKDELHRHMMAEHKPGPVGTP